MQADYTQRVKCALPGTVSWLAALQVHFSCVYYHLHVPEARRPHPDVHRHKLYSSPLSENWLVTVKSMSTMGRCQNSVEKLDSDVCCNCFRQAQQPSSKHNRHGLVRRSTGCISQSLSCDLAVGHTAFMMPRAANSKPAAQLFQAAQCTQQLLHKVIRLAQLMGYSTA